MSLSKKQANKQANTAPPISTLTTKGDAAFVTHLKIKNKHYNHICLEMSMVSISYLLKCILSNLPELKIELLLLFL